MTRPSRASIVVLVGVTLLGTLLTSAVEAPLFEERPFLAVRDSLGLAYGPVHSLSPGRYRWRVEATLDSAHAHELAASRPRPDIAHPPIWMGLCDAQRDEFDLYSRGVWEFEFRTTLVRTFDFPMKLRHSSNRRLVWGETNGPSAIVPSALTLTQVRPLLAMFGGPSESRRVAPQALLRLLAWWALLVVAALGGGWLRVRFDRGAGDEARPSEAANVAGWLLAFVAAGCALAFGSSNSLLDMSGARGASAMRIVLFPGLDAPWTQAPALATTAALLAAGLFGALVVRHSARIWTLPVAACALGFAAAQFAPRSDFLTYLQAGSSLWSGVDPYPLKSVLNPPPFLFITMLLALPPVAIAAFLWFGIKTAALVLCVAWAAHALSAPYGLDRGSRWARPEWIALLATGRLIGTDMMYGNSNLLVLACLLATAAAWRAKRPVAAGAATVAGVALKATPGMFAIAAALAGRWRWAASVLLVAGAITGASALALEARAPGAGLGFVKYVVPDPHDLSLGRVDNQSLRGWLSRSVGGAAANPGEGINLPTLGWGADATRAFELGFVALILLALVLLGRRARRSEPAEQDARWADVWAAATLALLLISPGSWTVHFVLLYLPLTVLAARARIGDRWAGAVVVLLGLVITLPAFSTSLADVVAATSALTIGSLVALAVLLRKPPGSTLR